MEPQHYDYSEDLYYYLEEYEEDSGPYSEQRGISIIGWHRQ